MARKRKNKNKGQANTDLVQLNATMKKLNSQLTDPSVNHYVASTARGIRERYLKMNFTTLRNVVDRLPLINAILNTRIDQVLPYCNFTLDTRNEGFTIVPTDREARMSQKRKRDTTDSQVYELGQFFEQTGFVYDPEREDDFMDYVQQFVRETLTIDQVSTEIQQNRIGEPVAFWLLDGATIKRVDEESEFRKGVRFVQEIDNEVYARYTHEDLIFDYKNKRADIRYRGYGYSYVEQAIDIITTLLFGYNYLKDQLVRDRMPKGFISVMGDVGKDQLDSIRSYWYAAMSGAGGQWNIPILPSGKEGVGMDFKQLGSNNKDMEYHKLMLFVSSVLSAVYGIDLAEMGMKSDDSQPMSEANPQPRMESSKDRGLNSLLSFLQQHLNKIIRKVTTDYKLEFTGVNVEDEDRKVELRSKQLKTTKTINELREMDGDEPIDEDYAEVVLNEQAVQLYQGAQQEEMGMDDGFGGNGGDPENQAEGDDNGQKDEQLEKSLRTQFRRITNRKRNEKVVRHIIE